MYNANRIEQSPVSMQVSLQQSMVHLVANHETMHSKPKEALKIEFTAAQMH